MRLCQTQLRAFGRSLAAASLFSGVMAALWLVAAVAGARAISLHLAHQDTVEELPLVAVLAIALAGASLVQAARNTLLNRRAAWLDHSLSECVVAHELWRASDNRQLDRSLGAVAAIARFAGSPAAIALVEAPWAMAGLGGLWLIDIDLAAMANGSALVLLVMALTGSRITRQARQFDAGLAARHGGYDAIRAASLAPDASLERACDVASRWEATQRALVAWTYAGAQARVRRQLFARMVLTGSACGMGWIASKVHAQGGVGLSELIASLAAGLMAQGALSRAAVDARSAAYARAALRHLATLRVASSRQVETWRPAPASPDLRAPIAAAWLAAAASVAGLGGAATYWNLPVLEMTHGLFAAQPAARASLLTLPPQHLQSPSS